MISKLEKEVIKNQLINLMDKYYLLPHPQGNAIKSTTEMYLLLRQLGLLTLNDTIRYRMAVSSLMIKKGLLVRYPESPRGDEPEAHDDFVSVACSCGISSRFSTYALWFFLYGLFHFFRYDYRKKANGFIDYIRYFRQPYQIGIFSLCSGITLPTVRFLLAGELIDFFGYHPWTVISALIISGVLEIIHLWGAIILEGYKPVENTSGKLLMWQLSKAQFIYKFLIWIPLKIFNTQLKKQYGNYPAERLFAIYYGQGNAEMGLLAKLAEGVE